MEGYHTYRNSQQPLPSHDGTLEDVTKKSAPRRARLSEHARNDRTAAIEWSGDMPGICRRRRCSLLTASWGDGSAHVGRLQWGCDFEWPRRWPWPWDAMRWGRKWQGRKGGTERGRWADDLLVLSAHSSLVVDTYEPFLHLGFET